MLNNEVKTLEVRNSLFDINFLHSFLNYVEVSAKQAWSFDVGSPNFY
jgi:hypothetical protein